VTIGPAEPLLRIRNLEVGPDGAKSATSALLKGIDLDVAEKDVTVLIGESGCGKTMLCRALTALLPPGMAIRRGQIFFRGIAVKNPADLRGKGIFYAPQNAAASLNPTRRIGSQAMESSSLDEDGLQKILNRLGFSETGRILNSYPFQLSGGENQRCLLALALALRPQLMLLDEPTSALDPGLQNEFLQLLGEIQVEFGLTLLLITHNLDLVHLFARHLAIMKEGRIVESGPTEKVLAAPTHPYTREIVSLCALLKSEN